MTKTLQPQQTATPELIERFRTFYKRLDRARLDDLSSIYDKRVIFRDPVHEIRDINELHAYMMALCGNLSYCKFDYLDQLIGHNSAYIKWNMSFSHPKLASKQIVVRGVSHIEFDEFIHYHEDVYDLGEMLYDHLPLIGSTTRWLKRRLAKGSNQ